MSNYSQLKVTWYQKTSESGDTPAWDEVGEDITDLVSLNEKESLSGVTVKQDYFKFVLSITDTDGDGFGNPTDFGNDDLVHLKMSSNGGSYSTIMIGKVSKLEYKIEAKKRNIFVTCVNRTQTLMKSVFALKIDAAKPPMMIKDIIAEANEFNITAGSGSKLNYVYYDEDDSVYKNQDGDAEVAANLTIQRQTGDITSQQAGTSQTEFEEVTAFSSWYEPAYEQVQSLSGFEITGDGNYIFYVDNDNNFYWHSKSVTAVGTLSEGTDFQDVSIKQNTDDVINFAIIHCGSGPRSFGVITYAYNETSIIDHGLKGSFIDETNRCEQLMKIERETNGGSFSDASYPYPSAYNYVMSFTPRKAFTIGAATYAVGATLTATTDLSYSQFIEAQAKAEVETEVSASLETLGLARWEVDVTLNGTISYNKDDLINVEISSIGWTGDDIKQLRVYEISHRYDRKGWTTNLALKEDEDT